MRVLQVIDSLALGGAEILLKDMVPKLRNRGIQCDVVALVRTSSAIEDSMQRENVAVLGTGVTKIYSPRHIRPLARIMLQYDLCHVHLFPAQLWACFAAALLREKIPLITTEHCAWNSRRRWWFRLLDARMYSYYDHIVCISEAVAGELTRWCPKTQKQIQVIPNGIPLEAFESAKPAELSSIQPNFTRVVVVSRFDIPKDQATVIKAIKTIPNAHLLLVGDGPLRLQLEQLTRALGIMDRVSFLGWRNDVAELLKAADIYVHSTNSDGFGIAACEAMAAGLPIVASNVPGLAQVVEGAGVLFPPGDDISLACEIRAIITSTERRRLMSQASCQRARQFSIEKTIDGHIEMYRSVLRTRVAVNGDSIRYSKKIQQERAQP
jgi:glycosyltransferase involved in cell wall biosynthesis